jgi:hypothetical protein
LDLKARRVDPGSKIEQLGSRISRIQLGEQPLRTLERVR